MKIALLISGRIARYDVCLIPFLENLNSSYEIDLFLSINDETSDCEYYKLMMKRLEKWVKGCDIKKYTIPEEIAQIFDPNESVGFLKVQVQLQKINGKFLPYNCLSMYYNDNNSFNMACNYSKHNNFEYDVFMKYRSDIINTKYPLFSIVNNNEYKLHCVTPLCNFPSNGLIRKPIVSDAFAWGNKKIMEIYCNTYQYVLHKIKKYNGKYFVAFECSLSDNIYENNIPVSYYNIPYSHDKNRRMYDDISIDSRPPLNGQCGRMKITDMNSVSHIPISPQI